jgi:hypothetical protein
VSARAILPCQIYCGLPIHAASLLAAAPAGCRGRESRRSRPAAARFDCRRGSGAAAPDAREEHAPRPCSRWRAPSYTMHNPFPLWSSSPDTARPTCPATAETATRTRGHVVRAPVAEGRECATRPGMSRDVFGGVARYRYSRLVCYTAGHERDECVRRRSIGRWSRPRAASKQTV